MLYVLTVPHLLRSDPRNLIIATIAGIGMDIHGILAVTRIARTIYQKPKKTFATAVGSPPRGFVVTGRTKLAKRNVNGSVRLVGRLIWETGKGAFRKTFGKFLK